MTCPEPFFLVGSTNEFYYQVNDELTGVAITTAVVTASVLTTAGAPFLGPFVGTHIAGGKYNVVIPFASAATFVDGTEYILETSVVDGSNKALPRITGEAGDMKG